MTVGDLVQHLSARGVRMTPHSDGTLRCRAPKGVLTPALVDAMRQHKAELHALVEAWSERAAMAEYDGGLSRLKAEALAWRTVQDMSSGGDSCPPKVDTFPTSRAKWQSVGVGSMTLEGTRQVSKYRPRLSTRRRLVRTPANCHMK